jgi:hypothetical protein
MLPKQKKNTGSNYSIFESLFTDIFVIFGFLLIEKIELPTYIYLFLSLIVFAVIWLIHINKANIGKPIHKIIASVLILFWLIGTVDIAFGLRIEFQRDLHSTSFTDIIILASALLTLILLWVFKGKNTKAYNQLRSSTVPVLFSLTVLSVSLVAERYADPGNIIFYIYLPMRILMIEKKNLKWYQITLALIAAFTAFKSEFAETNYPIYPVSQELHNAFAFQFACRETDTFKGDKVIEVIARESYKDIRTGKWYFIVSDVWNHKWRTDKARTVEYLKKRNLYSRDSADLEKIFELKKLKYPQMKGYAKALKKIKEAEEKIATQEFQNAEKLLQDAEVLCNKIGDIYYLKARVFAETGKSKDSICSNLYKSIEAYHPEAVSAYRKFCIRPDKP